MIYTNKLYQLFIETITETLNSEIISKRLEENHFDFYKQGEGKEPQLRPWKEIFRAFSEEYYFDEARKYLEKQNLTKINETTLFGVYKENYFEPLDMSLIMEGTDPEIKAKIYTGLMGGENKVYKLFKKKFWNVRKLQDKDIDDLWDVFKSLIFELSGKEKIEIFDDNIKIKNGILLAINDGYLKITNDNVEFLPLKTKLPYKTVFRININSNEVKNWNSLSAEQDKENYSIFKNFVAYKTDNVDLLSIILADLYQPLINTEILPIMVGIGGGGKSTLQNLMSYHLGDELVGHINLVSALNNPFEREQLYTKPVCFTSELESSNLKETALIKNFVSRERGQLNLKYQGVKKARPIAKMFIASNDVIKTTDADGLNRRLTFLGFKNVKIREDLDITEFEKELKKDVVGFTALIIYGTQYLLNKGWNFQTFNLLSDQDLQQEFEGQYNILDSFINMMFKNNYFKSNEKSYISLTQLADMLHLFNQSQLNTKYIDDELLSIIESFNYKTDTKKQLIAKIKKAGFERFAKKINNRYKLELNIDAINVKNERIYVSNIGFRYQQTNLLSNIAFNINNENFIKLLETSYISGDKLDLMIPDFISKLNTKNQEIFTLIFDNQGYQKPLKDIKLKLSYLFSLYAPMIKSMNQNRMFNEAKDDNERIWKDVSNS